jgi:hypothetical protein
VDKKAWDRMLADGKITSWAGVKKDMVDKQIHFYKDELDAGTLIHRLNGVRNSQKKFQLKERETLELLRTLKKQCEVKDMKLVLDGVKPENSSRTFTLGKKNLLEFLQQWLKNELSKEDMGELLMFLRDSEILRKEGTLSRLTFHEAILLLDKMQKPWMMIEKYSKFQNKRNDSKYTSK